MVDDADTTRPMEERLQNAPFDIEALLPHPMLAVRPRAGAQEGYLSISSTGAIQMASVHPLAISATRRYSSRKRGNTDETFERPVKRIRASSPEAAGLDDDEGPHPTSNPESADSSFQRGDGVQLHLYHTTNHYQSTVVNNIQHAENASCGVNLGTFNQTMHQTATVLDPRILDSLPRHPDVSGLLSDYLEGSRDEEMEAVYKWIAASPELVLWVHAPAGLGKSTFARHLGEDLRSKGRLAAAIFMSFAPGDWGPETVVRLIAGEIGRIHPEAIPCLADAIKNFSGSSLSLPRLFDVYIRRPIESLRLPYPLIILIDAIDEWRSHLAFIKHLASLESCRHLVRLVILGRPAPNRGELPGASIFAYALPPASNEVIARFFITHFDTINWGENEKPGEQYAIQLAQKAKGVFVWAWTVCSTLMDDFIDASPMEVLVQTLHSERIVGDNDLLAELYHGAIVRSFPRANERDYLRRYLQAIFVLEETIPIAEFSFLIGMEQRTVRRIRKGLRALQTREPTDFGQTVYPATAIFHMSVTEYFQSASTPGDFSFSISVFDAHAMLGEGCLKILPKLFPLKTRDVALRLFQVLPNYVLMKWPVHVTHAMPPVEPSYDVESWKKTQLWVLLQHLPPECLQAWADTLLQSTTSKNEYALDDERPLDGDAAPLLRHVGNRLGWYDPKVAEIRFACVELAVRLHPHVARNWNILGWGYHVRADVMACPGAAERAVSIQRRAVQIATSDPGADIGEIKHALASSLSLVAKGRDGDEVEEVISLHREVLQLRPEGHKDRPNSLNNLAKLLKDRSDVTGAVEDLKECIRLHRDALRLRPIGHPVRSRSLNNLANSLRDNFKIGKSIEDLEESICLYREALELRPEGHEERSLAFYNLAGSLCEGFKVNSAIEDLEESIRLHREALKLRTEGHQDRPLSLGGLANGLHHRFKAKGNIADLEESVRLAKEALELRPEGIEDHSDILNTLTIPSAPSAVEAGAI